MSNENSPLLNYRLFSVVGDALGQEGATGNGEVIVCSSSGTPPDQSKKLSTFFGVVVPTVLSMFSIVVFMRIGFVVGHAGFLQSLLMLVVAYIIICLTVLSVSAIATNGAVQGGGAYFMISRTLGPEFGGSIGLMIYLANVCACGVYILGLVEAILDEFGMLPGTSVAEGTHALPQSYLYNVLYATIILLFCMVICMVGADIYSKASFLTFLLVNLILITILVSFFAVSPQEIHIVHTTTTGTKSFNTSYTGFNSSTFKDNLFDKYSQDYTTNTGMTFAIVFAVMFNGCTGIMAGSNMSGDLKNPSNSIPKGTIIAVVYTFIVYLLLFFLVSFTCERVLLQEDYSFFKKINVWPPFVTIGIYSASLSASMSSLIGASRILHALAKDDLFGIPLAPAKKTSKGGNPWVAVLYTWGLVQIVLFAGKLNTIAGIVTIFYLMAYAAVDLACLALEWASAPNFRPTFQLFSWHTCLLGILSCFVMMFLINPAYASGSIVLMIILLGFIHYRSSTSSWGYISQALIFHQVRKYLLLLDIRKEHVKFWRPQVLLMVANPRASCQLIQFVNDLKKGGLYVLGHVEIGDLDTMPSDPIQPQYNFWLSLVDKLNVKAFVDLTLSPSVRQGTQHLLRITGLDSMYSEDPGKGIFVGDETSQDLLQSICWGEEYLDEDGSIYCLSEEESSDESVPSGVEDEDWPLTDVESECPRPQAWVGPFSPLTLPCCDSAEEDRLSRTSGTNPEDKEWGPNAEHAVWSSGGDTMVSSRLALAGLAMNDGVAYHAGQYSESSRDKMGYSSVVGSFSTRTLSHPSFYPYYAAVSALRSSGSDHSRLEPATTVTEQEARRTQPVPPIGYCDFFYSDPLLPAGHRVYNCLSHHTQQAFGSFRLSTPPPIMSVCPFESLSNSRTASLSSSKRGVSAQLECSPAAVESDATTGSMVWRKDLSMAECDAVSALLQLQNQACTTTLPEIPIVRNGAASQIWWPDEQNTKPEDSPICDPLVGEESWNQHGETQVMIQERGDLTTDVPFWATEGIIPTTENRDHPSRDAESGSGSADLTKRRSWRCMDELEAVCGLLELPTQNLRCGEGQIQGFAEESSSLSAEVCLSVGAESTKPMSGHGQEEALKCCTAGSGPDRGDSCLLQQSKDSHMTGVLNVILSGNTEEEPFTDGEGMPCHRSQAELCAITALLELQFSEVLSPKGPHPEPPECQTEPDQEGVDVGQHICFRGTATPSEDGLKQGPGPSCSTQYCYSPIRKADSLHRGCHVKTAAENQRELNGFEILHEGTTSVPATDLGGRLLDPRQTFGDWLEFDSGNTWGEGISCGTPAREMDCLLAVGASALRSTENISRDDIWCTMQKGANGSNEDSESTLGEELQDSDTSYASEQLEEVDVLADLINLCFI